MTPCWKCGTVRNTVHTVASRDREPLPKQTRSAGYFYLTQDRSRNYMYPSGIAERHSLRNPTHGVQCRTEYSIPYSTSSCCVPGCSVAKFLYRRQTAKSVPISDRERTPQANIRTIDHLPQKKGLRTILAPPHQFWGLMGILTRKPPIA